MAKLNSNAKMSDQEFNCLLAISSDAFDIHDFLAYFIKGATMNQEQYKYLLDHSRELLDNVKALRNIIDNRSLAARQSQMRLNNDGPEMFAAQAIVLANPND